MNQTRRKWITEFTEFLSQSFSIGHQTSLTDIADDEGVSYYFDNYEDAFDGMLLYDNRDFHIHLNINLGNSKESKRGRFTIAHELGHYFIDEHRLGLKYGLLEPHASFHNLHHRSLIEVEADYFASCLLLPKKPFKKVSAEKGSFSLDTILHLSDIFRASVPSTVIRFAEVGTHEIFAVCTRNGIVQWYAKSEDFPNWKHKFKIDGPVPSGTVIGEYQKMPERKYTTIEQVDADSWFSPPLDDNRANRQMYEQCYYSSSYGYIISILWFK